MNLRYLGKRTLNRLCRNSSTGTTKISIPKTKSFQFDAESILNPKIKVDRTKFPIPQEKIDQIQKWTSDTLKFTPKDTTHFENMIIAPSWLLLRGLENPTRKYTNMGAAILRFIISTHLSQIFPTRFKGDIVLFEDLLYQDMIQDIRTIYQPQALILSNMDNTSLEDGYISEALIGSIYIDSGFESLYSFMNNSLLPSLKDKINKIDVTDYMELLKVLLQTKKMTPEYKFMNENVPKRPNEICVGLYVGDDFLEFGFGRNFSTAKYQVSKKVFLEFQSNDLRLTQLVEKNSNQRYIYSLKSILDGKLAQKITKK